MAITAVHVDDLVVPYDRQFRPVPAVAPASGDGVLHRAPAPVVLAAVTGVVEAVALVAGSLSGLAALLSSAHRPAGMLVALVLTALASWVVMAAWGGATVLDGAGRRLFVGLAWAELGMVLALLVAEAVTPVLGTLPGLPLPLMALLALAVPVGKLLLAGAPSTAAWLAQGPRVRERRAGPVSAHRRLCAVTLAVIGLALGAVALFGATGVPGGAGPVSSASTP